MKILEKFSLIVFSTILFILSIITCLLIFGWLDLELVMNSVKYILNHSVASNITLGVAVVIILLSIKCIFFSSTQNEKNNEKSGILLENDNGKLLVSKDTLENLTNSVVKSFDSAETVLSKVTLDKDNNLIVYVTLFVHPDAVIKDLSNNLQARIKETIKKSIDLEVKEVNIKVKNITPKKEIKVNTEE